MSKSHPNPTIAEALGALAKVFRTSEKEGVVWSHWQRIIDNRTARCNHAEYLKLGCPKVKGNGEVVTSQLPEGYDLARLILGDDFLSPEDMAKAYGWSYSDEQMANFANTLPDFDTLMWLKSTGSMLQATPPNNINLLHVRDLDNQLFYSKSEGWYAEGQHTFSREDVVKAGQWLMVRKEPYANSRKKTWDEQKNLLTDVEHVPNAPEVSYAVTAYYKVRDVYLLKGVYVRTSSVDADGGRVVVGNGGVDGLNVLRCYDGFRLDNLGVSSSRKNLDTLNT